MSMEEKFNEFFNRFSIDNKDFFNEIKVQRSNAINERKNNKNLIYIVEIGLLIILILLITVFGVEQNDGSILDFCGMIAFIFPMIIALKKRKELEKYEDIYQDKIIKNMIKYFDPNLEYYPNETIGDEDYQKMGTENFTDFNSSNIIKGVYRNNDINISKIITKYTYTRNSYEGLFEEGPTFRKKHTTIESFEGVFVKAKIAQNIKTDLYIKSGTHLKWKQFNNFIENINNLEKKILEI